ncbi:hypothetical protein, partial [Treponema sp.]|uniref:hypothetical protein n=1 Tax=Treponema sp. TaxID=166 RepID=UPI002579901A
SRSSHKVSFLCIIHLISFAVLVQVAVRHYTGISGASVSDLVSTSQEFKTKTKINIDKLVITLFIQFSL